MAVKRLTKKEKEAIVAVLHERLAGSAMDMRDALGLASEEAAENMMAELQSAVTKLSQ
jgi:hypothetical protein